MSLANSKKEDVLGVACMGGTRCLPPLVQQRRREGKMVLGRDVLPPLSLNQGGLSGRGRRGGEEGREGGEGARGKGQVDENLRARKTRVLLAARIKDSTLRNRKDSEMRLLGRGANIKATGRFPSRDWKGVGG